MKLSSSIKLVALLSVLLVITGAVVAVATLQETEAASAEVRSYDGTTNTLTITGDGAMSQYTSADRTPWSSYIHTAQHLVISGTFTRIGSNAFNGFDKLESIVFDTDASGTVTQIGNSAFKDCVSLKSVELPDSVTYIVANAFSGCRSLSVLELPSAIETIGANAFYGAAITSVVVPSTLKVASRAFAGSQLASVSISSDLSKLPDRIFAECSHLISVEVPESITSFGSEVFSGCSSLTSVKLPSGLKELPSSTFYNCSSLETVELPKDLTAIGNNAFAGSAVRSLVIPAGITTLSGLGNCTSLTSVTFAEDSKIISIGANALSATGLTSFDVPDTVVSLGQSAFANCRALATVSLSNSVTSIGERAFVGCTALSTVSLGGNLKSIGSEAFSGCTSLTAIDIPSSVTDLSGFDNCTALKTVGFPDGFKVVTIKESAFASSGLTGFEFGQTLQTVLEGAFASCGSLSSVSFSGSTSIGAKVFQNCTALSTVDLSNVVSIGEQAFSNCTALADLSYGNTLTEIPNNAFSGCTSIKTVVLSDTITSVGKEAYSDCTALTSVSLPAVTNLGDGAFKGCINLVDVKMDNVRTFGTSIFEGCVRITTFAFNEGLTEIPAIFSGFANLQSVTFPSTATSIAKNAFYKCYNLKTVNVADGCKIVSVGERAFYQCNLLTDVGFLRTVETIGPQAFYSCSSISSIYISNVTEMGSSAFSGCSNLSSVDMTGSQMTAIPSGVFSGTSKLESFTVPAIVTSVGSSAFRESGLTNIIFAEGSYLTSVGDQAFWECKGLKSVVLPETVVSIGRYAFAGSGLESFNIPDSVTSIDIEAFRQCPNLESVTGGKNLTSTGYGLFNGCTSLKEIRLDESVNLFCNDGVLYQKNGSNAALLTFPLGRTGSFTIPATVTSPSGTEYPVTSATFSDGSKLNELTLGTNLVSFTGGANSAVKTLYIPETTNNLSISNAFNPGSIENVAFTNKVVTIYNSFNYCNVVNVTIPESVTKFDTSFTNCDKLNSVTIYADSVNGCFTNCKSLESADLSYVQSLSSASIGLVIGSFAGCSSLKEINFGMYLTSITGTCFENCTSLETINLDGASLVVSGGDYTNITSNGPFMNCTSLKTVNIGENVKDLSTVFKGCNSLQTITVAPENRYLTAYDDMVFTSDYTKLVLVCPGKADIAMPNQVTEFGYWSIPDRDSVRTIKISDGVTSLEYSMLRYLPNLVECDLGNGITSISNGTFTEDTNLSKVTFGNNFKTCSEMFSDNPKLTSLSFGAYLESLPTYFPYVTSLTIDQNNPYLAYDETCGVYYTKDGAYMGRLSTLSSDTLVIPDNVKSIVKSSGYSIFGSFNALVLGDGVTSIESGSISALSAEVIVFGKSLTYLDTNSIRVGASLSDLYFLGTVAPQLNGNPFRVDSTPGTVSVHSNFPNNFLSLVSGMQLQYDSDLGSKLTVNAGDGITVTTNPLPLVQSGNTVRLVVSVDRGYEFNGISVTSGILKDEGNGTYSITGISEDAIVTVSARYVGIPVNSAVIEKSERTVLVNGSDKIDIVLDPIDATDVSVSWSSSDPTVVSVDNEGNIFGVNVGDAYISAVVGGISAVCHVTVKTQVIRAESIALDSELTLTAGDTKFLVPTILPMAASDKSVTWSSSKTSVATVGSDGRVIAKSVGSCVITATLSDGRSASCTVTVTSADSSSVVWKFPLDTYYVPSGGYVSILCYSDPLTYPRLSTSIADSDTASVTRSEQYISLGAYSFVVSGLSVGTTTLTVSDQSGNTATCTIVVESMTLASVSSEEYVWEMSDGSTLTVSKNANDPRVTFVYADGRIFSSSVDYDVKVGWDNFGAYKYTIVDAKGTCVSAAGRLNYTQPTCSAVGTIVDGSFVWSATMPFLTTNSSNDDSLSVSVRDRSSYIDSIVEALKEYGYNLVFDNISIDAVDSSSRDTDSVVLEFDSATWSNLSNNGATVTVSTDRGDLVISKEVLKSIVLQYDTDVVDLSISKLDLSSVSVEHRKSIGTSPVFSLGLTAGGKAIGDLGGTVTVTVPYALPYGYDGSKVSVWYLNPDGTIEVLGGTYNVDAQTVTFSTNHFSDYAIYAPLSSNVPDPTPTPTPTPTPSPVDPSPSSESDDSSSGSGMTIAIAIIVVLAIIGVAVIYLKKIKG